MGVLPLCEVVVKALQVGFGASQCLGGVLSLADNGLPRLVVVDNDALVVCIAHGVGHAEEGEMWHIGVEEVFAERESFRHGLCRAVSLSLKECGVECGRDVYL